MKLKNAFGLAVIVSFIVYALLSAYYGKTWEYGACYSITKVQMFLTTGKIYEPIYGNTPSHPWPYNPLFIVLFSIPYTLFHWNPILISIYSTFTLVAAGIIAGETASKISGKDITLFTAGLFLLFPAFTGYGTGPRVDNYAILFLSLAVYYMERHEDEKTLFYAALSFLAKESYVFTVPLLYLARKDIKNATKTLAAYIIITAVLFLVPNYFTNVMQYAIIERSVLDPTRAIQILYTTVYSGLIILVFLSFFTERKDYLVTSLLLFAIETYMFQKPGSVEIYFYPFLLVTSIVAATVLEKVSHKKALSAILIILLIINYSVIPETKALNAITEVKEITKGSKVFSDNACITSGHYDWFLMNQYARASMWSWNRINDSIIKRKYDYVVLFGASYSGVMTERIPRNVYDNVTNNYTTFTTIPMGGITIVIYKPKNL